jgi:hypothetical protein
MSTAHQIEITRHTPPRLAFCSADECQRRIEWVKTIGGKEMPVDHPLTVIEQHERLDGSLVVTIDGGTSHFATCPAAARFRRAR